MVKKVTVNAGAGSFYLSSCNQGMNYPYLAIDLFFFKHKVHLIPKRFKLSSELGLLMQN